MNVFWDSKNALSQALVIANAAADGIRNWKKQTIFSLSNSLLDKGLIQTEGAVRSGKTYARTFSSTMSRPEYYAKMVAHTLNDKEIVVFKRTLRLETKKVDDIEDTPEAIMQ